MILRIVHGRFAPGTDVTSLVTIRDQLMRATRTVNGLESLMVGVRPAGATGLSGTTPDPVPGVGDGAVVTVWRDVEAMRRATGDDQDDRLISVLLGLPFRTAATHHFELVDRAFGALPPTSAAVFRIVTIRSRLHEEARLLEILRRRQPRMIDRGLVGSQLGRRVIAGGEVEAVITGLWPGRTAIEEATGGTGITSLPDPEELIDWGDRLRIDAYEGIEIAPRLPPSSGPPLFIVDSDLRIVDITPTAAAILGMPAAEMVGKRIEDLSLTDPAVRNAAWERLLGDGFVEGDTAWRVEGTGTVQLRFVARRDVPIPGRHAVIVRRRLEPTPTRADLDAAIEEAFGRPPDR